MVAVGFLLTACKPASELVFFEKSLLQRHQWLFKRQKRAQPLTRLQSFHLAYSFQCLEKETAPGAKSSRIPASVKGLDLVKR